jgi:hypothetical protein
MLAGQPVAKAAALRRCPRSCTISLHVVSMTPIGSSTTSRQYYWRTLFAIPPSRLGDQVGAVTSDQPCFGRIGQAQRSDPEIRCVITQRISGSERCACPIRPKHG